MTDSNDHAHDLPHIDDDTVEDLLKGGLPPVSGELDKLVHFLEEMRECIDSRAPLPSPALHYMLHHGAPAAPSQAATAVPSQVPSLRTPPSRRALLAAKAGLGITIAAATITTAAAAGVLPGDAERAVAGLVERFTPFQLPGPHGKAVKGGDNSSGAPQSARSLTEDAPRPPVKPTERSTVAVHDAAQVAVSKQFNDQSEGRLNGRSGSAPSPTPEPLPVDAEKPAPLPPADRLNEPDLDAEPPVVAGPTVDPEDEVPPPPHETPDDAPDRTLELPNSPPVVPVDAAPADTERLIDLIRAVPIAEEANPPVDDTHVPPSPDNAPRT